MKFIAHRGNLNGPNKEMENKPDYIDQAIATGYDVEIDVWVKDEELYLGHDEPQYLVDYEFLKERQGVLWCHAKNLEAFEWLLHHDFHTFFHDKDEYTLTSRGIIWAYPGSTLSYNTVCVMPENAGYYALEDLCKSWAICTDWVLEYGDIYKRYEEKKK